MGKTKRKTYTLFINFWGLSIPIKKDTIYEIDDFTTYFESYDGLANKCLRDLANSNDTYFYIQSSKGNTYRVLLNNCRFILNFNNKETIIDCLLNLSPDDLIMYIENNTKILEYMESDKMDFIPLYRLYKLLLNEDRNYINIFKSILTTDYMFYRNMIYFYKDKMPEFPSMTIYKEKKEQIEKELEKVYKKVITQVNNELYCNHSNQDDNKENDDNIRSAILSIIKGYDDPDKIYTEISFLFPDLEESGKYFDEYYPLIFKNDKN